MKYTRIYNDEAGDSYFQDIKIDLKEKGIVGHLSEKYPVKTIQFRTNPPDYNWDFHNAPARQFIILLDGKIEVTTSLGETRIFNAGEVVLVEDTMGKGHKTKNLIQEIRHSIFIEI